MEELVRKALPRPRSAGHRVPSTAGGNPDAPQETIGAGREASDARLARLDRSQFWGRHPQMDVALGPYEELCGQASVSGRIEIDPGAASVWRLRLYGDVTLAIGALPPLPEDQGGDLWSGRARMVGLTLLLQRINDGTTGLPEVAWPQGLPPELSTQPGLDVVVLLADPAGGWLGFPAGTAMAVPA